MRFRLFGIPIEVQGYFWATALLVAFSQRGKSLDHVLAVIAVVFVAVLVHELGHALAARAFGRDPSIVLHSFGGRTATGGRPLDRWRSLVVTLAGPLAGFALGAVALVIYRQAAPGLWRDVLDQMMFCTFGWGILNLMPVLPLDGGLVMRDLLGPKRIRWTLALSAIFACSLTAMSFKRGQVFVGVLFAISAYQSARAWLAYDDIEAEQKAREQAAEQALAAGQNALEAGRGHEALQRAAEAMTLTTSESVRDGARRVAVGAAVADGEGGKALEILAQLEQATPSDDVLRAQAMDVSGDREGAFALLRRGVAIDPKGPALGALLRGLVATGRQDEAFDVASEHRGEGPVDVLAWLAGELPARQSASLFDALHLRTGDATFGQRAAEARAAQG